MIVVNKKGHLDVRNALGIWSFIKEVIDIILVIAGGGILSAAPNLQVFSLVFMLWIWCLIKALLDTPLNILWLVGKIRHLKRKKARRKRAKEKINIQK